MRHPIFLAPLLTLALAAPALALDCPAERAIYELTAESGAKAGFVPAKNFASMSTDLYFWVETAQQRYWFTFVVSNGYGGIWMLPISDPYVVVDGDPDAGPTQFPIAETAASLGFYPLSADMDVASNPPNVGEPAPAFIFTPELGPALWYAAAALSGSDEWQRDSMDREVFRLTGCLDTAPEPAYP